MGGKKPEADVCPEFGLVNSAIQKVCKNRTKIIRAFEQSGSRTKRFRKPERSDVEEALLKRFKCERTDLVAAGGPAVTGNLLCTVCYFELRCCF